MRHRFQIIVVVFCCAGIISWLSASSAWAGPFREVVDECKKKSRMGDSFCMSIIRNNLTVSDCVKQTGFSEAECEVKIQAIKDDPEFSGSSSSGASPTPNKRPTSSQPSFSSIDSTQSVRGVEALTQLRIKKERDLFSLWERTQLIIGLLKKQGVEVREVEAALPELERRSEALLAAYDTYRSVYEGTIRDVAATRTTMRSKAQEPLEQAIRELVEYYEQQILMPLRALSEQSL